VRHRSRLAARLTDQRGFGIVEVVVAAALALVIAGSAFATFDRSNTGTRTAERHEVAVSLAQRELERLRRHGYAALGLSGVPASATPTSAANPADPAEYVSGSNLLVRSNFRNRSSAPPPGVSSAGEPFAVVTGGIGAAPERVTAGGWQFDVHRFVTWVDLTCVVGGTDRCAGPRDGKRITVAVRPVALPGSLGMAKPLWATSVLTDPTAVSAGALPPKPSAGSAGTAQAFHLYDTRCNHGARQAIGGSHAAADTGTSLVCADLTAGRPDLMGTAATTQTQAFDFSTDLPVARGAAPAAGLGLLPPEAGQPSCPTAYTILRAATDKHRVHRWVTPAMASTFTSTDRSAMTLWTRATAAAAGEATFCVSLHKVDGLLATPITSVTFRVERWPQDRSQLAFTFQHPAFSLAAGQRLMLTLSLATGSLPAGIELFYDDPIYDTVLSVGTTTPLP